MIDLCNMVDSKRCGETQKFDSAVSLTLPWHSALFRAESHLED